MDELVSWVKGGEHDLLDGRKGTDVRVALRLSKLSILVRKDLEEVVSSCFHNFHCIPTFYKGASAPVPLSATPLAI